MVIGKSIRAYRIQEGYSQDELAARVFVSRQTVSNWETDKNYPDLASLLLLSEIFAISLDQFLSADVEAIKQVAGSHRDRRRGTALAVGMIVGFVGIGVVTGLLTIGRGAHHPRILALLLLGFGCLAWQAGEQLEKLKHQHGLDSYLKLTRFWEKDSQRPQVTAARAHKLETIGSASMLTLVTLAIAVFTFTLFH